MICLSCNIKYTEDACPNCGPVSVGADSLDSLVQKASTPNLADLFRKAKQAGVITAGKQYGDSN